MKFDLTATIKLDYCWVTGDVASLHEHHIIPRECGGENGPTVTLSSDTHTIVHRVAEAYLTKPQPEHARYLRHYARDLPPTLNHAEALRKIDALARVIVQSTQLTKADPNRRKGYQFKLTAEDDRLVQELKTVFSVTSKEEAILRAIRYSHASLTRPIKP